MFDDVKPHTHAPATRATSPENRDRYVASESLFGDATVVLIRHAGATYTLRKTRAGKLILTK